MNINWLVGKENKRVAVSNEKGEIETREYQDNMGKLLLNEDILEGLENDYSALKNNQIVLKGRLEVTNKEMEKNVKNCKISILLGIIALFGGPVYICGIEYMLKMKWIEMGLLTLKQIVSSGIVVGVGIILMEAIIFVCLDTPVKRRKKLKKQKEDFEKRLEEIEIKTNLLELFLSKNRKLVEKLAEQKENDNIQNVSSEVHKISYRETLELQRSKLERLYQDWFDNVEDKTEQKSSILGRFRKKKIN